MSFSHKLLEAADVISSVTAGVQMIDKLTGTALPHQAAAVLPVIGEIAKAISSALAGNTSGQDLLAELNKLHTGLAANDAAADSELDKKFPTG